VVAARAALEAAARRPSPSLALYSKSWGARILAWAGAFDESVELLEEISQPVVPSLGPAAIVRDPLFAKPLGGHRAYEFLAERLEKEIASNRTLLQDVVEL
jgi:hypothetical protein